MISRDQFIVYILEATAIAVVGTVVLGRSPIDTSLFLLIASLASANIIMDLYAPKISGSMRQGAGFGLGMKQVGGTTEELYDARPKPDLVSRIAEFKNNNPPPPQDSPEPEIRQWKKKVLTKMIEFNKEALITGDYKNMGRNEEQLEQDLQRLTKDLQDLFKSESESVARLIKGEAEARLIKSAEKARLIKAAEKARLKAAEKARLIKAVEKERFFKEKEAEKARLVKAAEKARFFKEKEAEKPVKPLSAGISGETYNAAFEIFRTTNNLKGASPDQLKQIFDKPNASKWYEMANTLNNHAKTIMKNTSDRFDSENMCQTKLDKICTDYPPDEEGQDSEPCKLSKGLLPYMMHQPFTNIDSSNRSNCATFPPEHILREWPKPVRVEKPQYVSTQKPKPVRVEKPQYVSTQKPKPVRIDQYPQNPE